MERFVKVGTAKRLAVVRCFHLVDRWTKVVRFFSGSAGSLAIICGLVQGSSAEPFIAFNDYSPGILTHSNATTLGPSQTGHLKDISTGKMLSASLSIRATSISLGGVQGEPSYGSPASIVFNGFVDFSGQDTPSLEMDSATDVLTYHFTGLDPAAEYNFQGSAVRGHFAYTDRWSVFEIVGAKSFVTHPTPGALTRETIPSLHSAQFAINTGNNDQGACAWWEHIQPAADGTFSVTSRRYDGVVPGASSGGSIGYGLVAVRLEEGPVYSGRTNLPLRARNPEPPRITGIKTVFLIVMENHDWTSIKDSEFCPYINTMLLPNASYATQYYSEPGVHPSEPNYLWMIAGTNFGIRTDDLPAANHQSSTNTLFNQLDTAGISWKSYQEDISGKDIPVKNVNHYVPRHNPFMYFDQVRTNLSYATNHIRPYAELAQDLADQMAPALCFIIPNLTNDMHTLVSDSPSTRKQGDDWLKRELPTLLSSSTFTNGGVIFLTWDEGNGDGDGPMGLIALSPRAKGRGYHNSQFYTHSSLLRTLQDIFGVKPYLGEAAYASSLADLFVSIIFEDAQMNQDGTLHLTIINAASNNRYRLESTEILGSESWTEVSTEVAPGGAWDLTVPVTGKTGARFYRLVALP